MQLIRKACDYSKPWKKGQGTLDDLLTSGRKIFRTLGESVFSLGAKSQKESRYRDAKKELGRTIRDTKTARWKTLIEEVDADP